MLNKQISPSVIDSNSLSYKQETISFNSPLSVDTNSNVSISSNRCWNSYYAGTPGTLNSFVSYATSVSFDFMLTSSLYNVKATVCDSHLENGLSLKCEINNSTGNVDLTFLNHNNSGSILPEYRRILVSAFEI